MKNINENKIGDLNKKDKTTMKKSAAVAAVSLAASIGLTFFWNPTNISPVIEAFTRFVPAGIFAGSASLSGVFGANLLAGKIIKRRDSKELEKAKNLDNESKKQMQPDKKVNNESEKKYYKSNENNDEYDMTKK